MADEKEGIRTEDGGWKPIRLDSPFRQLTGAEVAQLQLHADDHVPSFEGPHNAPWASHHPVAREVWERKGVKPS